MNRVFKTVWNCVRGCYVAVNEAVTGAAQSRGESGHVANLERKTTKALKLTVVAGMVGMALALNAGMAGAEEIKTSQTISDAQSYDGLTISGTESSVTVPKISLGKCGHEGAFTSGTCSQASRNAMEERGKKYAAEAAGKQVTPITVTLDENARITVKNDLFLTHGDTSVTSEITYKVVDRCTGHGVDMDCYYSYPVISLSFTTPSYANLTNNGGALSATRLSFENAANTYTQTAGRTTLQGFTGGGQVNLSGGTFNISNLDSGAKVTATGGTISADTINLTSKSLSMTNTQLNTGLNQVADFKQVITQAQALLMDGTDQTESLNASVLGRTEQVSAVLDKFKNNVTWSGGAFHFTGSYTQSVADTAKQVIQAAYGTNVGVTFDKVVDDPTPADVVNGFTAAVANAIIAENSVGVGTIFRDYQADARLNALLVGDTTGDNVINSDVGFKSINGAKTVTVTDQKELALLGNGAASTVASGEIVADNGTLRLGSANDTVTVGGKLAAVTLKNDGLLKSQRGDFNVVTVTGDGSLEVASGTLILGNFDITGGVTNAGNLVLSQNQVDLHGGTNTGTLTTKAAQMGGEFSNDKGTWNLNGGLTFEYGAKVANGTGTINTAFANLYDNGLAATQDGVRTISLTATAPEAVKETLTDLFTKYVPGSLKEAVVQHMTFDGAGKVVITDANLTKTQRDDLTAAFKKAFGDTTQLVFNDVSNDQQVQASVLNTAKVNQLHDAKLGLESVIYVDRDLQGEGAAVVIGNAGVKNSTGFAGIANAKALEVTDGKNLVLIGGKAGATTTPYQMAGVLAQVGAGSTLTLGSLGLADTYAGTVADVQLTGGSTSPDRATLKVAAGQYTTGAVTANHGTISVDQGATLTTGAMNFVDAGELVNRGTAVVNGKLSAAGDAKSLSVSNYGDLTINDTASVIGTFTNNANAQAHLADVNVIGTLTNSQNAFLEANKVSVLGQLANFGRIEASDNSEVYGTLNNSGVIELYNTTVGNRGAVNNTYTLKQTGLATVNGLLSNVEGAQAHLQTLVLDGKDAKLTNTGTMVIDSLTLKNGAQMVNGPAVTGTTAGIALFAARAVRGKQVFGSFDVQAGTSASNGADGFYGTGTIDGTFTTAATGNTTFGASAELPDAKGYTVSATGKVENAGTTTFGGSLTNAGSITGAGTLVFAKADGALNTFNNAGTVQAGTLTADGVTYNQTVGSLTADNGWFTNSTVNLTGGTITHDTLGKGNTYNLGRDGNTKGDALFTLSRLTSDSVVNIRQGSTLHADSIALSGDKTTHLLGGVLGTTLDQIFDSVSYDAHDIDAKDPDDKVQISGAKIATGVGNVLTSVARGIEFNWGTVAFDDASYSVAMAADALNKLDAVDEASAGKLEIAFNGKTDQAFGVDLANKVVATKDGSTAYATFVNETLTNTSAGNPDADTLVVGTTDRAALFVPTSGTPNVLQNSMGFKNVTGVTGGLWINSGKHLVLVGDADGLDLADGTVIVGGVDDNAVHSLLTLGSYATTAPTKGHLKEVYLGVLPSVADQGGKTGTLQVRHGDFTIDTLHNGSLLQVGGDGKTLAEDRTTSLTVTNLDMVSASEVQNDSILTIDKLTSHTGTGNHVVHNNEKATMTVAAGDLNGQLMNAGTFKGTDLTLRMTGSENSATGTMDVTNLTVFGDSTWGTGATARGGLVNVGTITTTALKVAGDFDNESAFATDTLALTGNGTVTNKKTGTADSVALAAGTTLTNTKDGTLTVNGTKAASTVSGALANAGTLSVAGDRDFTLAANGMLTNSGSYSGHLTINGGAYTNTGTSVFDGLTMTAGSLTNTSGSVTDTGSTSITMANKTDVAIANKDGAMLGFADLQLNKGTISGGVIGTADTVATVGQQGVMQDVAGVFKTLTNAGSLTFTDVAVSGKFTNTGSLVSTGTATLVDLDNQAAGRLTLASGSVTGANAGTITAAGALTAVGSNSGTVTVSSKGSFTVEAGKSYDNTKTLTVNGAANVDGTLTTAGTFTAVGTTTVGGAGTVTSSGTTSLGDLALQTGAHFNLNGGTTAVKNLAQADGVTYTQTAGTFAAEKGWFTNSTLNIEGGKLDAASIKDAEGNPLGSLGVNTVNISGANPTPTIKDDATAEEKSHYKDNLTVVTANTVTSDTTVNINAGGVLDVGALDLTEKGKFTLAGGVLQTSLDQIFGWVNTIAVDINAKDPETGTVEVPTKVLASTTVGKVKDSIKDNAALESGTIAFDDDYFSASTIVSSSNRFASAFDDTSKVELHFLGTMESPFNVDTAKQLADEGTAQVLAGIVLDTTTLHNETRADGKTNTKLVIGDTDETEANRIGISMGFQNVANADSVTVNDGKQFVLVGTQKAEGFDWMKDLAAGQNQLLLDAADGGSVAVNNGVFTFGSDGVAKPTVGWIKSSTIDKDGSVVAKNGEFADWTIANSGTLQVNGNAILHTNSYTGEGIGKNSGTFDVDGTFEVGAGGFTNAGTLDATDTPTTKVTGTLTNEKTGTAKYDDMLVAQGGSSVNAGSESGDLLHIGNGAAHTNTGTSVWNGVTIDQGGALENGTALAVGDKKGDQEGFTPTGTLVLGSDAGNETIAVNGDLTNHGVLDASKSENTVVASNLVNDGQAQYQDMTVTTGGSSVNDGYEKGKNLTMADGATHTNTGTSIWENATVDKGGSLTNGTDTGVKGDQEGFKSDDVLTLGIDKDGETVVVGHVDQQRRAGRLQVRNHAGGGYGRQLRPSPLSRHGDRAGRQVRQLRSRTGQEPDRERGASQHGHLDLGERDHRNGRQDRQQG